jgi:hypothetical protein
MAGKNIRWYWLLVGGLLVISLFLFQMGLGYIWAADVRLSPETAFRDASANRAMWALCIAFVTGMTAVSLTLFRLLGNARRSWR